MQAAFGENRIVDSSVNGEVYSDTKINSNTNRIFKRHKMQLFLQLFC